MSGPVCFYSATCARPAGHEGGCRPGERRATPKATDVVLCAQTGCPRAASYGPWCVQHRARHRPDPVLESLRHTHDFSEAQYAAIRRQLAIDAAPYILAAFQFIASPALQALVAEADALPPAPTAAPTQGLYL